MSWTLKVGLVEKTLNAWGVAIDFSDDAGNKQRRTVNLRTVERFDAAALQWNYLDAVTIYKDRSATFTGGTIWFQGFCDSPQRVSSGGKENVLYRAHNVWWLLAQHKFIQTRKDFNGWTVPNDARTPATFRNVMVPEIFIGQKADGTYQTNGDQIREVIDWFNECWNPTRRGATAGIDAAQDYLQAGTIDVAVQIPVTRVNSPYCTEVIQNCLRLSPDAVTRIDESTTPPTLHVLSEGNQPVIEVELTEEQASEITAQRQDTTELAGEIIYYRRVNTFNGVGWPETILDVADADGTAMFYGGMDGDVISNTGMPMVNEYTPFVDKTYIELGGQNATKVTVPITVAAAAGCQSATPADRVTFWKGNPAAGLKAHDTTLGDSRIDSATLAIEAATITDKNGNAISLDDYPHELIKGTLANWMGVQFIEATVKAKAAFYRYDDEAHTVLSLKVEKKEMNCTIKLTNAITKDYQNLTIDAIAEEVPQGVAKKVFDSLNTPRQAGTLRLVNSQVRGDIFVGCRLTLIGPNNTYTGCVVQTVSSQPQLGRLTVSYGPTARCDASALVEIGRAARQRTLYNIPCDRTGGQGSSAASVSMGDGEPKENTVKGEHNTQYLALNDYPAPTEGAPTPAPRGQVQIDSARAYGTAGFTPPSAIKLRCFSKAGPNCDKYVVVLASDLLDANPFTGETPIGD